MTIAGYPAAIYFIIANKFCERFGFYGVRTVLALYLVEKLEYTENRATAIYHMFRCLVFVVPLIGALVSDVFCDKFKTIVFFSIIAVIGSTVITVGALPRSISEATIFTLIGLVLIAIGAGGKKPCNASFGVDQFILPDQAAKLSSFFSVFYFTVNAGCVISTSLTPIFRKNVHCFDDNDCYSLAFGVPGAVMIISIIILIGGKPFYIIKKPVGNIMLLVCKCITNALYHRCKKNEKKEHWLDYSVEKYGKELVDDVKLLLNVVYLLLSVPVFWALFEQKSSRWTFQARKMDGDLGFYLIKPDQMQVINPILTSVMIPLYGIVVHPCLSKIGIKSSLRKLATGQILAGLAFIVAGLVELYLEKNGNNSMHIFWQVPQYVLITAGEVMFSVTGLQISFTEAPILMKSVMQAIWLLTVAAGNVIVIAIANAEFFESQAYEFFLFAALMFLVTFTFSLFMNRIQIKEVNRNADSSSSTEIR